MDVANSLANLSLDINGLEIIGYARCNDVDGFIRNAQTSQFYLTKGDFLFVKNGKLVKSASTGSIFSNPIFDHGANFLSKEEILSNYSAPPNIEIANHSLISSTWDSNFFHFIFDVLGKVAIHDFFGDDYKSIKFLFNVKSKFQKQFMDLLGLSITSFDESHLIKLKSSYLPSYFCTQGGQPPLNLISFLRHALLEKRDKDFYPASSKIFLSRRGAGNGRSLLNEELIYESIFAPKGYIKYIPDDLTIPQQITLFASAKAIAGVHGGAFSLMPFANYGTNIFEIHSPNYFNPCFKHLAKNCNHIYASVNEANCYFMAENWNKPFIIEKDMFNMDLIP